jgi:chemotaxis protein methyltransferase CheR
MDPSEIKIKGIPEITDREFELFRRMIFNLAGVHMNESKKALVRGRLLKRIRYYDLNSYREYYDLVSALPRDADEVHILTDLLTTHETYFFREPEHFDFLKEYFVSLGDEGRAQRIWIAAASTGEEAYSAAMIAEDVLNGRIDWEIIASDISRGVLDVAESALYTLDKASKIPDTYLKQYCLKGVRSQEGLFTIVPEIKKKIRFKQINLMEDISLYGEFDIIFLRNVMIYFTFETKADLIKRIMNKIKTGGYLIVGHSESLNTMSLNLKWVRQSVYQKL